MWMLCCLSAALAAPPPGDPGVHGAHIAQFGAGGAGNDLDGAARRQGWDLQARAPVALPAPAGPPVASGPEQRIVYGYHPYWGDDPTQLDFDGLTHLAIFEVGINSDGSLSYTSRWTDVAPAVVPLAHAKGVRVHLCAISFEDSVHHALLPSASRRATLIANLKALVEDYGADGVNIDIEGLDSDLRDDMVTFLQELDAQVGDVWVATPAVDWSEAWDEAAMSQLSGGMFIMGYGYHWTGGDPGPNDPLYGGGAWSSYSLSKTVDYYLSEGADPAKIVMGLPLYGQEWPVSSQQVPGDASGGGWSVVMSEAEVIAAQEGRSYDTTTLTPYVLRSGTQLWYGDNDSVTERIRWSVEAGLGGVGFWALGYEGSDAAFWSMVKAETYVPADPGGDSGGGDSGGDAGGDSGDPSDQGPVARAGETITAAPGDTVVLNGGGSADPQGLPLAWEWAMLSGPEAVTLENADEAAPSFVAPGTGRWTFQLTVRSVNGTSPPDTVDVVVERGGMCGVTGGAGGAAGWLALAAGGAAALRRSGRARGGRRSGRC